MNRIKTAYENAAPGTGELAAYREEFIKELDAPRGAARPINTGNSRRWRRVAIVAACLVVATVSVMAFTGKMSIAVTPGDISAVKDLGIDLPEMIGEFKQDSVSCNNWVSQGVFDIKSILDPVYKSYTVRYEKAFDIVWHDRGPYEDPAGFSGSHTSQSIYVGVGSSAGFSAKDWERFAGYDGETKKWIPYGVLIDNENETVSYENVEELEYRGATIWLYDVMRHNKNSEPEYCSDAGVHFYDPEKECFFYISFVSPGCLENRSESYDKDGDLIHKANEKWVREYNYLSKSELLGYIKEIIDMNR